MPALFCSIFPLNFTFIKRIFNLYVISFFITLSFPTSILFLSNTVIHIFFSKGSLQITSIVVSLFISETLILSGLKIIPAFEGIFM